MGFDNDCILNIQSLAGEYFCPVCRLLVYPNEALQAQCSHLYCKPCLTYVVSTTHACPYDGYRVTEAECKPLSESNKALADTIGKIQVHCLYYTNGCTWQGTLSDCSSHCSTCSFGEYPVVCIRCSVQIVHRQAHDHARNCQGVQPPAQQPVIVQDTASLAARTAAEERQTVSQTGISTAQVHNSQTSAPLAYGQGVNPVAKSNVQPQDVMPTPEQWQQYQQYYQQFPGYDPSQQYQYQYQYQQVAQQYPHQPMRGYPQPYGQAQPQVYAQTQLQKQPQIPSHTARSQPAASAPPQGQAQHQLQSQPQKQSQGGGQPQIPSQGPAPITQALPYNQSQPYVQPQPINQQTQVPPYHQTPQVQYYYTQPYPQSQTTQGYPYTHPQSQLQSQPHSQPTFQVPAYLPSQQNQPINPGSQLQTQNAISSYQAYPQPQPHSHGQGGAARPMHVPGAQPQHLYPPQMQGIYPQSYSNAPNQQLPAVSSTQGQPPNGPTAQQPHFIPHPHQSGYPFQHHPGVLASQETVPPQQHGQQQSVAGHGAQHNTSQSYAARPVALGAGSQSYASAATHAGYLPQTSKIFGGEKSMHDVNNPNKGSKNLVGGSSAGVLRNEVKVKAESSSGFDRNNSVMGSKLLGSDAPTGVLEPSRGNKSAKNGVKNHEDVQKKAEVHGTNAFRSVDLGRNQLQPLQYGPSAQLRPGAVSMSQSTPHPFNSQQSVMGPSQAPPRPSFDTGENSQPSSPKYPPGFVLHENTWGEVLTSGSSGPFSRPGNNYYQGSMPPYQDDQPKSPSERFGGSSFAAQRPGAFDSHVGIREREPNFEERHPYPMENEKFPVQRPGYFDGRKREASPYGSLDRAAYGHIQSSAHDSMYAAGMRVERGAFPEERIEHFPLKVEDELKKFPGPSHFEVGHSSKFGAQFPSSGALDDGPHVYAGDGPSRPFDKAQQEFDCVSGLKMDCAVYSAPRFLPQFHPNDVNERGQPSGFPNDGIGRGDIGQHADLFGPGAAAGCSRRDALSPRSPGRDFPGRPSRTFGVFGDGGDVFSAEPFGKSIHDSRYPIDPNHLQREEIDVPGTLHVGGPRNQDMLPNHMRMGEPPLTGNFSQHLPFGGEKLGHPPVEEPGFKGSSDFQHFGCVVGFYPEEMEPVDDPTKLKPVGLMCRICKVDCGTVEGLDYHSQSREHQRNARDMALSIKQQNRRQKISKDQASFEGRDGGSSKKFSFQGRRTKG